ncbi:hypothetical protein GOP47_0004060 [Adiantum capillus-veneris]|uniref:RNA-dependent RNA polymerase n=1 Tax=Adiantum capillus-veneris TaxID=13818 RepID=A0A9D4V8J8_ADICA|nr:hypothetical protein GOP47_0004060 [Adiantum capillus-veneris]
MGLIQSKKGGTQDGVPAVVSQLDMEYPDTLLASFAYECENSLRPSLECPISQPWLALGSQEQWIAFGQLPFPKRQLILTYFSQDICMEKISSECFNMFKTMDMFAMESWLQQKSQRYEKIRISHEESGANGTHFLYRCEINKDAHISAMDMILCCDGTPLQRAFGYDNVLQVHFGGNCREALNRDVLYTIFSKGLHIGLRTYMFYGMKDEQQKRKGRTSQDFSQGFKCVFLCLHSESEHDLHSTSFRSYATIHDARQYLGHFHTVSKLSTRISRIKLALSKTYQVPDLDFTQVKVQEIEDICCKDGKGVPVLGPNGEVLITTDGAGFISENLIRMCPIAVFKGKKFATDCGKEFPLFLQVRLFFRGNIYKGVLLVNKQLPPNTIQVRRSMKKVENDPRVLTPTYDSLEVCATSRRPSIANVFQHLVLLLLIGGVPQEVFLKLAEERLEDMSSCFKKIQKACKALEPFIFEKQECQIVFKMLLSEIRIEEPFVTKVLVELRNSQLTDLSNCRFPVEGTYYLKGCADPTGILGPSQVVILREHPVIAEEVLVYKPPGLHPGDIRKFQAIQPPQALRDVVGSARFGIFFSVHGERSATDQMANADLDGDEFWICENQEIIRHFQVSPPWMVPKESKTAAKPKIAPSKPEDFELEHIKFCMDAFFEPSFIKGQAANNWLALMDKYVSSHNVGHSDEKLMQKCLRLVDIYYEALDAEKTGKKVQSLSLDLRRGERPHFMESIATSRLKIFESSTVLGQVFDMVKRPCNASYIPPEVSMELDEQFLIPGHEQYFKKWSNLLQCYGKDMRQAYLETNNYSNNVLFDGITEKYRQILYGAPDFSRSRNNINQIHMEASAIYKVVYIRAQRHQELGWFTSVRFVWIIAGDALLDMIRKPGWWSFYIDNSELIVYEEMVFLYFLYPNVVKRFLALFDGDHRKESLESVVMVMLTQVGSFVPSHLPEPAEACAILVN